MKIKMSYIVGGALALVLAILLIVGCLSYTNTRNELIKNERGLSAQYLDNQNYLSAYISGFYEQVSVAQAQNDALDKILLDAVKGRYAGQDGGGGYTVNSPFFAAIVEAYPEAGVAQLIANWGKIQDYIAAGREGYRNTQSKLLDMLRAYDTWRESGILKGVIMNGMILHPPTKRLEARIGDTILTGEAARNKMYQIVLTSLALKAYEDGTLDPLTVP